jgi:hypothetical protein
MLNADPLHKGIDPAIATLLKIYPDPSDTSVGDGLNTGGYRFNNPTTAWKTSSRSRPITT